MANHALFSPSRAHRDLACPGAAAMEHGLPDTSSVHADEGTAAHFLGATCLESGNHPANYHGQKIVLYTNLATGEEDTNFLGALADPKALRIDSEFTVDTGMVEAVNKYVMAIRDYRGDDGELLVEQRVPVGQITGEEGATGTSDAIIVRGTELQVHDYKHGRGVEVFAADNPQLRIYALGALDIVEMMGHEVETVRLVIHQPRIKSGPDEEVLPAASLREWGLQTSKRYGDCQIAFTHRANWVNGPDYSWLNPGTDQCKFCKAKANCPALAERVQEQVGAGFDDLTAQAGGADYVKPSVDLAAEDGSLADKMAAVELIEDWCKAVRAEVERRLLAGQDVRGYKLVQGRAGARAWADAEEAEKVLKSFRLKQEEMYEFKLISPTTAEKLLATASPKRWVKCQPLISRSEGKPSVAPVSDKRPAIKPVSEQFDDLTEGEALV